MCQESALVERPSCSSTRNHSVFVQPWPPCSGACRPPDRPRLDRLALDALLELVRDLAAAALGQLLVGDQHLVDEAPRALLQVELLGREVVPRVPGRRGSRSWLLRQSRARCALAGRGPGCRGCRARRATSARASATAPVARGGASQRRRLGQVGPPRTPAAARDEPLHARPLQLDQRPRSAARRRAASRSPRQLALGFWGEREPCVAGAERDPRRPWYHATDHKVRIRFGHH